MNKQQSIYASLNVCQCEFDKNLPQKQKTFNDLGNATENFLNIYLPANAGFVSAMSDTIYPRNRPFYVPNIPTITLGVNYGVIAYLFKKAEGKSDGRAAGEATLEFIASWQGGNLGGYATQKLATKAASRFGIAMAGRILGGAVGSVIPVGGTIIGAVAGAWLANKVEEWWFSDEDKALESAQAENERIAQLEKAYLLKINHINDYLIRNNYVELRELDKDIFGNPLAHSNEAETLCKEASNLQSSYFKTILLMLSFPQYLDRKQEEEEKEQRKQERKIQPVKDAILLTLDIEKCIDTSKAELLKEKEIYIYNERFKRVVAKSKSDDKGRLQVERVSVGKEIGIDRLSFVVDRENLSEDNFDLSIAQYSSITNVQTKHKKTKELKLPKAHFSFNIPQAKLQCDYEVLSLKIHKSTNTITLIPETNLKESRYKPYLQFAYMVFEITDTQIDTSIKNITLQNRQMSGLNSLGNGLKTQYPIKKDWENKVVVFFAFFNTQQKTPYAKIAFIEKPIVVLDAGHGGKDSGATRQNTYEKTLTLAIAKKLQTKLLNTYQVYMTRESDVYLSVNERYTFANKIQNEILEQKVLFISIHINSGVDKTTSRGIEVLYYDHTSTTLHKYYQNGQILYEEKVRYKNQSAYLEKSIKTKKIIEKLKIKLEKQGFLLRNPFDNKQNSGICRETTMPTILIECGFINNSEDRKLMLDENYQHKLANAIKIAIDEYFKQELQ